MRALILAAAAMTLAGCTTLSNISKLNRMAPVVDSLVYLQDNANQGKRGVSYDICDSELGKVQELERVARLMGWTQYGVYTPEPKKGLCITYIYTPKP